MSGSAMRLLAAALTLSTVAATQIDTGTTEAQQSEPLTSLAEVPAPPPLKPYWQRRGCNHGHRFLVAHGRIRKLIRNHNPYVRKKRVQHYATCVERRKMSRKLNRFAKRSWQWRKQYAHIWAIRLNRLPAWTRNWATSTAWCESDMGQNPRTNLNGFRGRFQWVMSTWYAAGGAGDPAAASYEHEAVIAIGLMLREGAGHWPNCG